MGVSGSIHDSFLVLSPGAVVLVSGISVLTGWMCGLYIVIILFYAQFRFEIDPPSWLSSFQS